MPTATFGQKTTVDGQSKFVQLKSKGEKLHLRIINSSFAYDGKHFIQSEVRGGKWDISYCPRIMNSEPCPICEKYFELKKQIKDLKERKEAITPKDKKKLSDKEVLEVAKIERSIKELESESKNYNPKITFYYSVLNREVGLAQIFKTSVSVRKVFETDNENGVNVLEADYIVKRTEETGNYYSVTRLDSKDTKPLTPQEEAQIERGKKWVLEEEVIAKPTTHPLDAQPKEIAEPDFLSDEDIQY